MEISNQEGCIKTAFRSTLTINNQQIGNNHPVYTIAEIGRSFNDLATAERLIKEAAKAGADAVKIQSIDASELLIQNSHTKKHYNVLKSLELTLEEHQELKDIADSCGIAFLSTPESLGMVELLEKIGVPAYKIASLDITYNDLLRQIGKTQKPIILSTGMATIAEIQVALNTINLTGNNQVILLYCVSLYPPNMCDLDLRTIQTLKGLGVIPGFSDHTVGTLAALTSIALGAKVVEKHFTLSCQQKSIDHQIALEPNQFYNLVKDIRQISKMLGSGHKVMSIKEQSMRLTKRRKLVAAKDISRGTPLREDMLSYLQLDNTEGLPSSLGDYIIRKKLKESVNKGQLITQEIIKW